MNIKNVKSIDELIKHSSMLEDIKKESEKEFFKFLDEKTSEYIAADEQEFIDTVRKIINETGSFEFAYDYVNDVIKLQRDIDVEVNDVVMDIYEYLKDVLGISKEERKELE